MATGAFLLLAAALAWARNVTVGSSGREFTTIQAALDAADAGDVVVVDDGTYAESVTSKKDGARGQEISVVAARYLGATLTAPLRIAHKFHVLRGFRFASIRSATPAVEIAVGGQGSVLEWCAFGLCEPQGTSGAVVRVLADDVAVRANAFADNAFGASTATQLRVLHVANAARVAVVGNLFADKAIDAARVHDVVFDSVVDGSFRQNAVSVAGFPDRSAALFSDCKSLTIAANFFRAAVEFGDAAPNRADDNIVFVDNTVTVSDDASRAPLLRFVAGTINNASFDNNLLTNCGGGAWLRASAAAGSLAASAVRNSVVLAGDQYCTDAELVAGSGTTITDTLDIADEQSLAFDETSGCNGLPPLGASRMRGATTNYIALPFTQCFSSPVVQLYPFPYPPAMMTTPPPTTTRGGGGSSTTPAPATEAVGETLPPTPPPTPAPPATTLPDPTLVQNVTFAPENTTVAVVDPGSMIGAPESLESTAILIIVGPLIVCILVIGIMTLVAFLIRRKKKKELEDEAEDSRWGSTVFTS